MTVREIGLKGYCFSAECWPFWPEMATAFNSGMAFPILFQGNLCFRIRFSKFVALLNCLRKCQTDLLAAVIILEPCIHFRDRGTYRFLAQDTEYGKSQSLVWNRVHGSSTSPNQLAMQMRAVSCTITRQKSLDKVACILQLGSKTCCLETLFRLSITSAQYWTECLSGNKLCYGG